MNIKEIERTLKRLRDELGGDYYITMSVGKSKATFFHVRRKKVK